MTKNSKIAKVVWEARKAFRPWDSDNPIKKWSSIYENDKTALIQAVTAFLETGEKPVLKNWTEEEIGLLCKIAEYLNTTMI